MALELAAKAAGAGMRIEPVTLAHRWDAGAHRREAYERLILDTMRGDATLFTRDDEVEAQWRICDPVLQRWRTERRAPAQYPAGSQGPLGAATLLAAGDAWRPV